MEGESCVKKGVWIVVALLCIVTVSTTTIRIKKEKSTVSTAYIQILNEHESEWTQFSNAMLLDYRISSSEHHLRIDSSEISDVIEVFAENEKDLSGCLSDSFDYVLISKETGYVDFVKELGIYSIDGIPQMFLLNMCYDIEEIHPDNMKFVVYTGKENSYYWSVFITHY